MDTQEAKLTDKELDVRGLNCPLPILKARKALAQMQIGETLEILTTDPGSVKDFEAFCRQTGNKLLCFKQKDGTFIFHIQKKVEV